MFVRQTWQEEQHVGQVAPTQHCPHSSSISVSSLCVSDSVSDVLLVLELELELLELELLDVDVDAELEEDEDEDVELDEDG